MYPEGFERKIEQEQITYQIFYRKGWRTERFKFFNDTGIAEFESVTSYKTPPELPAYVPFWAACFMFSHIQLLYEVPFHHDTPFLFFGEEVLMTEDPKELFPFVNELAYSVTASGNNQMNACYWIEWIIEYENRCKALKEKIFCERRNFAKVDSKYQKDIIWIIWDIFLKESSKRSKIIQKIVESLLTLFCLKYATGCHKKRKNLMYLAISILCEKFIPEKEIIRHSQIGLVNTIKQKIDLVYAQIKKNEESTGTDYLFLGMKSSNLESTIKKLDAMNSFGESFVPRL
jgi:hypothetical protein